MTLYLIGYTILEIVLSYAFVVGIKNTLKLVKEKKENYLRITFVMILAILGLLYFLIQNSLWLIDYASKS